MTKTMMTVALVVALFGGIALADDGNMGSGGYTQCGGTNPPPTCPPAGGGGGGFADVASTGDTSVSSGTAATDITLAVSEAIVDALNLVY